MGQYNASDKINLEINIMRILMSHVSNIWKLIDRNQRRWVEYNDYFNPWHTLGDRVPPVWHGWMAHVYDEVPTRTGHSYFVQPFY